jgi:multiple sugar transport system ATP-binding protein
MAGIQMRKLNKVFGKVHAVRDLDLDIAPGELCVFVGPSGCGKSTLLRLVAGLEAISGGELRIDGERVNDTPPPERGVAMVFQSYALYPHMNVYRNMAFGLRLAGTDAGAVERRVREVATLLRIDHLLERLPRQLSGGQRQRVAIGRAIVRRPKVFLFDEPLSNLDAKLRVEMRTEIKALHRGSGATIVYVTHDQVEAMTLGDRIVVMKDGEVQQVGTPQSVYDDPANRFVAGFMGSPSMNFMPVRVIPGEEGPGLRLEGAAGSFLLPAGERLTPWLERSLILGIRPERITATGAGPRVRCRIDLVEPTGPDNRAVTALNGTPVVCRIPADAGARPGEELTLAFDLSKAVYFDPDSDRRVA